ncbi:hypothetical protein [Streptomyces carpinensis]|uniref:hypothetical protein n=1 Tax=Streptomyces carpinensis TaxID=66369 RepID=UPI000A36767C|nr:hypothetical protein [Streptomyces carpinensis]
MLLPRPAWGKRQIMAEARTLGTADISRLPARTAAPRLLPPRSAATRSTPARLARLERRLDVDEVAETLLAEARLRPASPGRAEDAGFPGPAAP